MQKNLNVKQQFNFRSFAENTADFFVYSAVEKEKAAGHFCLLLNKVFFNLTRRTNDSIILV